MSGGLTAERKRELIATCWCRREAERCATCARWLRSLAARGEVEGDRPAGEVERERPS